MFFMFFIIDRSDFWGITLSWSRPCACGWFSTWAGFYSAFESNVETLLFLFSSSISVLRLLMNCPYPYLLQNEWMNTFISSLIRTGTCTRLIIRMDCSYDYDYYDNNNCQNDCNQSNEATARRSGSRIILFHSQFLVALVPYQPQGKTYHSLCLFEVNEH